MPIPTDSNSEGDCRWLFEEDSVLNSIRSEKEDDESEVEPEELVGN